MIAGPSAAVPGATVLSAAGRIVAGIATLALAAALSLGPTLAASDGLSTQSPSSAQPTVPKSMPNLTVPVGESSKPDRHATTPPRHHRRHARHSAPVEPIDRPALANVELLEPLPRPPQPPHVTVPAPAYPLDSLATAFTTPPPPITCRPTRRDSFKPDLGLVDERPVLCTADNP